MSKLYISMKRKVYCLIVCALVLTGTLLAQENSEIGDTATVNENIAFIIVYAEPDESSPAIEAITGGSVITLIATDMIEEIIWWQIETPSNNEGWVQSEIDGISVFDEVVANYM